MKNITKILALLISTTTLTGCIDTLFGDSIDNGDLKFYASFEGEGGTTIDTRTALDGDGLGVSFVDNDEIKIYDGNGGSGDYTTTTTETVEGITYRKFTGSGCSTTADNYYAVYPSTAAGGYSGGKLTATVPAEQTAIDGTFDPAANVSVAKGKKLDKDGKYYLFFKNVCYLLRFEVKEEDKISAIIVKGNDGEYLAGEVVVDPTNGKYEQVKTGTGKKQIKLLPPTSSTLTNAYGDKLFPTGVYYMAVLPQTFADGISVKLENSIGSYRFKKGTVKQLSMNRSRIFTIYKGEDYSEYIPVAMLGPLANQDGYYNIVSHNTPTNFKDVTKIEFIANATSDVYSYADEHNQAEILHGSNVRAYKGTALGSFKADGPTLYVVTSSQYFSISDDNKAYSTDPASKLFNNYSSVTEIVGLNNIETTFVKNYSNMFYNCNALTEINIDEWDTSSAENMTAMFSTSTNTLANITVGQKFFASEGSRNNMFGINTIERIPRINFNAPVNVENLEDDYPLRIKQNTYFVGGIFKDIKLSENPPYYTDDDHRSSLTLTFNLDGKQDAIDALSTVRIGLIRFVPADGSLTYATQVKYSADEYAAYDYTVTAADKAAKKITVNIKTAAQIPSEPQDGYGYIYITATDFDGLGSGRITITNAPYSIDILEQAGQTAWVSGVSPNYTGNGNPIIGQAAKVTVYVNNSAIVPGFFDHLTIGDGWECTQDGTADEISGYTAYTTTTAHKISDTKENKLLTVTAHFDDGSTINLTTKAKVAVHGVAPDKDNAVTTTTGYKSSTKYLLQCDDYYLAVNGTSLSGTPTLTGVDGVLWMFSANGGTSTKIHPVENNAVNTDKGLRHNESTLSFATSSSNVSSWKVAEGSGGLQFTNSWTTGIYPKVNHTGYLKISGTGVSISDNSAVTVKVFPVNFPAP